MEKRIDGRSTPPEALAWFPPEKLVSARLIPESVLGVRLLKRGYVAQYEQGKAFVVLETSPRVRRGGHGQTPPALPGRPACAGRGGSPPVAGQVPGRRLLFPQGKYIGGYANMPDGGAAAVASALLAAKVP